MIKDNKNPMLEQLLSWISTGMLKRHFAGVHWRGQENFHKRDAGVPTICMVNHSCWWDALLAFYLSYDLLKIDTVAMMEECNLARYRFFTWIGAFGVKRDSPREAVKAMHYAVDQIKSAERVLWLFPQGIMLPNDVRPLAFYQGTARIIEKLGRACVIPITHRYEYLQEQHAEAFTEIGEPIKIEVDASFSVKTCTAELQAVLTRQLEGLKADLVEGRLEAFQTTLAGKLSASTRYDRARGLKVEHANL